MGRQEEDPNDGIEKFRPEAGIDLLSLFYDVHGWTLKTLIFTGD